MKFEEKLIELRKKAGLSQEQLAEKLDVTRQTISKWELGQTKPDIDKLKEMARIFEVDVNELTSSEKTKKVKNKKSKGTRKGILYIVIILLIAAVAVLGYRLSNSIKENKDNGTGVFDSLTDFKIDNIGKTSFNNQFELHAGSISAFLLEGRMSDLITSNKTNSNHLIELIFDGTNYGTDTTKISEMKDTLSNDKNYELSFEYDSEGYINKFVVTTKEKKPSTSSFNNTLEFFTGTTMGAATERMLSDIITSNQKYPNLQIEVVFDGISYGTDVNRIREAKNMVSNWNNYEISVEYDSEGYINKYIVETK